MSGERETCLSMRAGASIGLSATGGFGAPGVIRRSASTTTPSVAQQTHQAGGQQGDGLNIGSSAATGCRPDAAPIGVTGVEPPVHYPMPGRPAQPSAASAKQVSEQGAQRQQEGGDQAGAQWIARAGPRCKAPHGGIRQWYVHHRAKDIGIAREIDDIQKGEVSPVQIRGRSILRQMRPIQERAELP